MRNTDNMHGQAHRYDDLLERVAAVEAEDEQARGVAHAARAAKALDVAAGVAVRVIHDHRVRGR